MKNFVGKLTVGMSQAKFVPKGSATTLKSGPLTMCSVLVAQVHRKDQHVGTIMAHQGTDSPAVLRENVFAELKTTLGFTDGIKFKYPIVQTAPDTMPPNTDDDTTELLCNAMADMAESDEIRSVATIGPGVDFATSEMTAHIGLDGSFDVPKRKGMFECVIQ